MELANDCGQIKYKYDGILYKVFLSTGYNYSLQILDLISNMDDNGDYHALLKYQNEYK